MMKLKSLYIWVRSIFLYAGVDVGLVGGEIRIDFYTFAVKLSVSNFI